MHKLSEILTNDEKLCAILANTNTIITDLYVISSNIVNLGNPSEINYM